jgi:serine/threonine protein kinase
VPEESARTLATDTLTATAPTPHDPYSRPEWNGTSRYQVVRRIGEGAMGIVYEAFDRERAQSVAVKSLHNFTPAALYRFKQEFRTLADVHHRNLVMLHELVVTEGEGAFFVMELVQGTDFQSYVRRQLSKAPAPMDTLPESSDRESGARPSAPCALEASPADYEKLGGALRQVIEGIQALHLAGKLHRDIKPSNILVTPEGRVVILDFGVATELPRLVDENLSEEREIVGTIRYMAPEQAGAEEPTAASDWYSVGVMLYEVLAGRPAFAGTSIEVITNKALGALVPASACALGVPPELDSLCCALLDSDPKGRPSGREILRRLGAVRTASPLPKASVDASDATTLIGREPQLNALREAFEQVLSGAPDGRAGRRRVGHGQVRRNAALPRWADQKR